MEKAEVRRTEDYSRGKSGQVEAPDGTLIAVEWRGVVSRVTDEQGGGGRPVLASARGVGDGIVRGPGILPGEGTRDLCASSSLEATGILRQLANYLDANIPNADLIASIVCVASTIIDNVPLVAATMGMYDLTSFPQDSDFWQLVAFCAGTGGSMLYHRLCRGVALLEMEKVDFFWYLHKVSGFALAGYVAGIITYLAGQNIPLSLPTLLAEIPFITGS